MTFSLNCSANVRSFIEELLRARNIEINETSNICLTEKGQSLETGKICIVFELNNIDLLFEYLNILTNNKEAIRSLITGKNSKGEFKVLAYDNIYYFEAIGNDVICRVQNETYSLKEKLYQLEERLQNTSFIRVNKSFIVNIILIDRIIPWFNSKLILKFDGIDDEVDVTRNYLKAFKDALDF